MQDGGRPLLEVPALARSVYFTTRENQVIREELAETVSDAASLDAELRALRELADVGNDV